MTSSSDFHDQDFDALEDYLDHLPPAPQYRPSFTSPFSVWQLGRKLAKQKKQQGRTFSAKATVDYRQPLVASGGWISFGGKMSPELTETAKLMLTERFDKRGLTVSNFRLGFTGMTDGPGGTFQSLRAQFNVS